MLRLADAHYVPLLNSLLRPSPSVEIRRVDEEAWESVRALHALSRQETYASLLPGSNRIRFRPGDLVQRWRIRPDRGSLVLHGGWSDQVLLGFVATSPVAAQRFELNALHVRPDWHGRGGWRTGCIGPLSRTSAVKAGRIFSYGWWRATAGRDVSRRSRAGMHRVVTERCHSVLQRCRRSRTPEGSSR